LCAAISSHALIGERPWCNCWLKTSNLLKLKVITCMKFYILEDFHQVADEKSLLHFFNSLREAGVLLLLSARISSKKFKIEDLSSHLENIPTVVIEDSSKEVL
jgi:chromosomal replication initiation ATPase DnaA